MATRPIYELYNNNKTYMTPAGTLATPQWVRENYPATVNFPFMIETDASGSMLMSMDALAKMKTFYGIEGEMTDNQAVEAIATEEYNRRVANEEAASVPTAEERTAAALEFIALSNLPDEE